MNVKTLHVLMLIAVLGGCASSGGDSPAPREERPARAGSIPSDHPFSQVKVGMSGDDVVALLNRADDESVGLAGSAFNPFYFGPNQTRATWSYRGKGRIVFDRNMYTGTLRVVRVIYNPSE